MKILVTVSSKHGSAHDVGGAVSNRLRAAGYDVEQTQPQDVQSIAGYDAVVIGSSVYMRQWMEAANLFVERFHDQLKHLPVWAFSVGMSGVPKRAAQDPKRIGPVTTKQFFRNHQMFAGRCDPSLLTLRERSVARLAGAVEGDFRDWQEVDTWAESIVQALQQQAD